MKENSPVNALTYNSDQFKVQKNGDKLQLRIEGCGYSNDGTWKIVQYWQ